MLRKAPLILLLGLSPPCLPKPCCANKEVRAPNQPPKKPAAGPTKVSGRPSPLLPGCSIGTSRKVPAHWRRQANTVKVHYTGWLTDGKKFDSSLDHRGEPFQFKLGAGQVINGWDEGVAGMKVGGKRQLRIPAGAWLWPARRSAFYSAERNTDLRR